MVLPHYMGRSREKDIEPNTATEVKQKDIRRKDSFSSQSPAQDVPLLLPHEASAIESFGENKLTGNQKQDHYTQPCGPDQDLLFSFDNPSAESLIPDIESMDIQHGMSTVSGQSVLLDDWWEVQERDSHVSSADESSQVGPRTSCHCQVSKKYVVYKS